MKEEEIKDKRKNIIQQMTLLSRDGFFMACALPPEIYLEIKEAIVGIVLKNIDKATSYQWTMSKNVNKEDGEVLYATYPNPRLDFDIKDLENAHSINIELYGDNNTYFWCDNENLAEKIVNNKYLRHKAFKNNP